MTTEFCMECKQKLSSWSSRFGGNDTIFCKKCFKNEEIVQRHVDLNTVKNSDHANKTDLSPEKLKTDDKLIQEKELIQTNKSERYIAWGLGIILTLAILFLNNGSFSRYGFFASDIQHTMLYDSLKDSLRRFDISSSASRNLAYFLWFSLFGLGVYMSWKHRFKTATIVHRVLSRIHDNA